MITTKVTCDRCKCEVASGQQFIRVSAGADGVIIKTVKHNIYAEDPGHRHLCSPGCAALFFSDTIMELWRKKETGNVA